MLSIAAKGVSRTPSPVSPASDIGTRAGRDHLLFLDGLRGLAALYVTIHHAWMFLNWRDHGRWLPGPLEAMTAWLAYGHYAVALFIVLSGYCLMLPVAQSTDHALRGGASGYLWRRARRILPPYYAALALSCLLIMAVPTLQHKSGTFWDGAVPAFQVGPVFTHLLLIHNLHPEWYVRIDPPMWSVSSEWEIYFLFPLVLLPAWRRYGSKGSIITACLMSAALAPFIPWACPWYLALFALGMASAAVYPLAEPQARTIRRGSVAVIVLASVAFGVLSSGKNCLDARWFPLLDPFVGITAAAAILLCAADQSARGQLRRALECRPFVWLGKISYSLYLIHFPLLAAAYCDMCEMGLSPIATFGLLLTAGTGLCMAAAYLFHRAFEAPFMRAPAAPRRGRFLCRSSRTEAGAAPVIA